MLSNMDSVKKSRSRFSFYQNTRCSPYTVSPSLEISSFYKAHIFWEGHNILQTLPRIFDWHHIGQIYGGDFAKVLWPSQKIRTLTCQSWLALKKKSSLWIAPRCIYIHTWVLLSLLGGELRPKLGSPCVTSLKNRGSLNAAIQPCPIFKSSADIVVVDDLLRNAPLS